MLQKWYLQQAHFLEVAVGVNRIRMKIELVLCTWKVIVTWLIIWEVLQGNKDTEVSNASINIGIT